MSDVEIRSARPDDLPALAPRLGQKEFFADRLARQSECRGVLLVARDDRGLLGVVYLWLEPAEESEIRRHLPKVPLLTHLEVLARERGRGIGTLLIDQTEQFARELGHDRIALAVRTDNIGAAKLYERLGYRDWGHGPVVCLTEEWLPDGSRVRHPEKCYVLAKTLAGTYSENLARPSVNSASKGSTPGDPGS